MKIQQTKIMEGNLQSNDCLITLHSKESVVQLFCSYFKETESYVLFNGSDVNVISYLVCCKIKSTVTRIFWILCCCISRICGN